MKFTEDDVSNESLKSNDFNFNEISRRNSNAISPKKVHEQKIESDESEDDSMLIIK
jgi:hypothetical protein